MKRLLIAAFALLAVLGSATVAEAQYGGIFGYSPSETPMTGRMLGFKSPQAFVHWMGCKNAEVVVWDIPYVNAFFRAAQPHKIVIFQGLLDFFKNDPLKIAAILAHEAGHCMDLLAGTATPGMDRQDEFDAEAHAHKILTVLGYNASKILLEMRLAFAREMRISPDYDTRYHGSAHSISEWARKHNGLSEGGIQALWTAQP